MKPITDMIDLIFTISSYIGCFSLGAIIARTITKREQNYASETLIEIAYKKGINEGKQISYFKRKK